MDSGNDGDFEWDQAQTLDTAWSSVAAKTKGRRARGYGKTASQRREARRASKQKSTVRQQERDRKSDEFLVSEISNQTLPESFSSVSSFDGSSSHSSSLREPRRIHTRSKSVTALPSAPVPFGRHSRSHSVSNNHDIVTSWALGNSGSNDEQVATPDTTPSKTKTFQLDAVDEGLKARPRKIRNITNLGDLPNNFSDLAKSSETMTWSKAPGAAPSIALDITDLVTAALSPAKSLSVSVCSSRKRGVCDSLTDEMDDSSSFGGLRRSRTRIFSPPSTTRSVSETSNPFIFGEEDETTESKFRDVERSFESDDNESVCDSDEARVDFSEGSFDSMDNFDDVTGQLVEPSLLPPQTVRRSSSGNFEAAVFGAAIQRESKQLSAEIIVGSMSSVDDLKYLVRMMRKEKKGHSSFGMSASWTVAPSASWSPDRRIAFLQWSTKLLGFSVCAGGSSVAFLKVSSSKGPTLLSKLEAALQHWKDGGCDGHSTRPIPMEFSVQKQPKHSPLFDVIDERRPRQTFGCDPTCDDEQMLDAELLEKVNSMAISVTTSTDTNNATGKPLVRHVTIDPHSGASLPPESVETVLDNNKETQPRLSGEHHVGGQDLVSHLHGLSPMPQARRRPRLSSFGHGGYHSLPRGAPSPFACPPSSTRRSTQKARLSVGNELLETPQVKRGYTEWDGRQSGTDWGVHQGCPDHIIHLLVERFEARFSEEACDLDETVSCSQTSCYLDSDFAAAASSPLDEGIEVVLDEGDEQEEEEIDDEFDLESTELAPHRCWERRSSVGATALAAMTLEEETVVEHGKTRRRRMQSLAKHRRVSICAQALDVRKSLRTSRNPSFDFIGSRARKSSLFGQTVGILEESEFTMNELNDNESQIAPTAAKAVTLGSKVLSHVFSFLHEEELLLKTTPVCSLWADTSVEAHAALMFASVGYSVETEDNDVEVDESQELDEVSPDNSIMASMEQTWNYLVTQFPWACYLSEGSFKRVYKVWNAATECEEAISVMDVDHLESTGQIKCVGTELAVSAMLSSLVRRSVCPNFVTIRRVFTCPYEPPASHWGSAENKKPKGDVYNPQKRPTTRKPRLPGARKKGRYQYMRMELCSGGDVEEWLKEQPDEMVSAVESRNLLFQMAFSLHAGADRFSLKHYDVKLLNFFLQTMDNVDCEFCVLRYGLGSHVFTIRMPTEKAVIAKLADFGTANVQAESSAQPVTIAQFTTFENTPPEFLILGDAATQGHGHDTFGLGLCMLHIFTGHAPYEEILDEVKCPTILRKKLKRIWQDDSTTGYDVIRSVILADVYKDEDGNIVEGEPDETLYETLYRYLVLFGIPEEKYQIKEHGQVWRAITSCLEGTGRGRKGYGRRGGAADGSDREQYAEDCKKYSLLYGNNDYISRARVRLQSMEGGLELLQSLVHFDPQQRATYNTVMNSDFMRPLREEPGVEAFETDDHVMSYMSYATGN